MVKTDKPHPWEELVESRTRQYFPGETPKLKAREALDFGPPPAWQTRLISWRPSKGTQVSLLVIGGIIVFFALLALGLWLTGGW